jgi:hypothetical protein
VKESVFPFAKFPGVDTILGPEMRSTGEVMGIADTFARAFGKAMLASGIELGRPSRRPRRCVFISVKDEDKPAACHIARRLRALGFEISRRGARRRRCARARPGEVVNKVNEGSPHVVDAHPQRDGRHRRQHDDRREGGARQLLAAAPDAPRQHPVLHDHRRGARGVRRARGAGRADRARAVAPGVATGEAWGLRVASEERTLIGLSDAARDKENQAEVSDREAKARLATRKVDADGVHKHRARFDEAQRKSAEVRDEEASFEAWRPKR